MPIYEYECLACGQVHEIMQKMSERPLAACPHCSGKLQKLISHSSFHLKGSGWYATDYAKRHSGSSATDSDKAEKTSESTASKSDADTGGSSDS
jgi:putative FmdB family regulatory protein